MSTISETEQSPLVEMEYQRALDFFKFYVNVRRADLAFCTVLQLGVLAWLATFNPHLNWAGFPTLLLVLLTLVVCAVGLNLESRSNAYLIGYSKRAAVLERELGLMLVQWAQNELERTTVVISNGILFKRVYIGMIVAWLQVLLRLLIAMLQYIGGPVSSTFPVEVMR